MAPISNILFIRESMQHSSAYLAQDNSRKILTISGCWCFFSLLVVSLRIYVRGFMVKFFGWDDITILAGSVLGLGIWVCFVGEAQHGLGRHVAAINDSDMEMLLQWSFAHGVMSLLGIWLVKVSVAVLLLRITGGVVYRKFLYAVIAIVSIYSLICIGAALGGCNLISANWNPDVSKHAKCLSGNVWNDLGICYSVLSMMTDVVLALIPIPIIFKLQLNLRTRIAICIILSLGFSAVACGGIKTRYYYILHSNQDHFYQDDCMLWAALELYSGIVAASLPTLRPLMSACLDRTRISLTGTLASTKPSQTASHALPEILLSPVRLNTIPEWEEREDSFEDDSKNKDTMSHLDPLDSPRRSSVSSFGRSKINTTTLNLDSIASPTPVVLSKPPVKLKANVPRLDSPAGPTGLLVPPASSSGKSKINTTTLNLDSLVNPTPVVFSRPPIRPRGNVRNLRSFYDGVSGDPNYEQMTVCTRSRSIAASSTTTTAADWAVSPTTPDSALPASPIRHLFPADSPMRHILPPDSPIRHIFPVDSPMRQSFGPRPHAHRRMRSNTSNSTTKTLESAIVVTKKVVTSTESASLCPTTTCSSSLAPRLSFVGPCSPAWSDDSFMPPTPASPMKRTFDKVFRKHHGTASDTVYEDDVFGSMNTELDWDKLTTPMVQGYEGVELDWDALDAPMDYGSALLRVATSEAHGLSEKGSEAELVSHEAQDV